MDPNGWTLIFFTPLVSTVKPKLKKCFVSKFTEISKSKVHQILNISKINNVGYSDDIL